VVTTLDDFDGIAKFFAGFLIEQAPMTNVAASAKL
jgi:hypothetical protein